MKFLIKLFLLLNIIFINGQKNYVFDKEVIYNFYKGDSMKKIFKESVFINSKDQSYYLRVFGSGNKRFALLYDSQNQLRHDFDLINIPQKSFDYYDFKFDQTNHFNKDNSPKKPRIEYINNTTESKYLFYKSSSKKRINQEIVITKKSFTENLFFAFRIIALHPYEFLKEIDPNENIIVEKARIIRGKQILNYQLKELKELNFKIEIPK